MTDPAAFAPYLWICAVLVLGRVIGQLLVATRAPRWLPPMEQWQSGLLPYPVLVAGQAVVLTLMFWICVDFTRGSGFWVEPRRWLGFAALYWSYLYAGAMVVRYIVHMIRRPDQRWTGGTIPIIFHTIVAAFQWTFGAFHTGLL